MSERKLGSFYSTKSSEEIFKIVAMRRIACSLYICLEAKVSAVWYKRATLAAWIYIALGSKEQPLRGTIFCLPQTSD